MNQPTHIAVEAVSKCVLDCGYCVLKELKTWESRRDVQMRIETFLNLVNTMHWTTTHIQFSGGEPFLNPNIFLMFKYARDHGLYTLVATNARFLHKQIDHIVEYPPDTMLIAYDDEHGMTDRIKSAIKTLIAKRGHYPRITLQMVLTKKNIGSVDKFWAEVKDIGADEGSVKALGVWPEGSDEYRGRMIRDYVLTPRQTAITRHDIVGGKLTVQRKPGQCPCATTAYIGSGGEVLPCWYVVKNTVVMGNVNEDRFTDIWASYRKYRWHMKYGTVMPYCKRCIGVGAKVEVRTL